MTETRRGFFKAFVAFLAGCFMPWRKAKAEVEVLPSGWTVSEDNVTWTDLNDIRITHAVFYTKKVS